MQNSNHFTNDLFAEHFETFQQSATFERLQKKFTPLPYYLKYRSLKWIALIASYLFNIFSALTASTLVYFFALSLTGNWLPSAAITLAFLSILEISKRKTAALLFKDRLQFQKTVKGLATVGLLLIGLSVAFSYFGAKRLVEQFTPPPTLVNADSLKAPVLDQLAALDLQIEQARQTQWKGTTTTASQRTIETLSRQKETHYKELQRIGERTDTLNDNRQGVYFRETYLKAKYFAAVTLLLEMLFILCAYFLEYYDYRSFIEFAYTKGVRPLQPVPTIKEDTNQDTQLVPIHRNTGKPDDKKGAAQPLSKDILALNGFAKQAVNKAIKHVNGRIASAKYRLRNNIGRPETSTRNIEKHNTELMELQTML